MSQPQQQSRGNFMTTLLLMATVFLGAQLLFQRPPADNRKPDDLLKLIKQANVDDRDVDAAQLLPQYINKLQDEQKKQKWSQQEVDKREFEATVLVAQAKFRGALSRMKNPSQSALVHKKLNDAWMLLQQKFDRYHNDPVWQMEVSVTPDANFTASETTPGQLFDDLTAKLSERNKTELAWGLFPGYPMIDFLVHLTGAVPGFSYWFTPFLLALIVRVAVFPWSMKQYRFGRQMMQLQPYVKEIQEKFKDKRTGKIPPEKQGQASQESMALYKEYGINPLAGCGSAFIQMPFFYLVYQCMLLYRFEFARGTFLWIHPGATKFLGLNLAPNLGQLDQLLVIIYGVSMIVSQLMMPISDPAQVRTQRLMGIGMSVMFTFFMLFGYQLPAAFTLYWVFANILATAQAVWAYKLPAPPLEKVQTVKGGARPKPGFFERLQAMAEQQEQNKSQNLSDPGSQKGLPNGKYTVDPDFFGKTGSPRSKKKK